MTDLTLALRQEKEFTAFAECAQNESNLKTGRKRPAVVTGLCEGAEFAFVNNLADVARSCGYEGVLLIVSDEKKANRMKEWLEEYGKSVLVFRPRDPVLYHAGASHEYEHERLFVLLRLLGKAPDYLITTLEALTQYTIPPERLEALETSILPGDAYDVDKIAEKLEALGYHRTEMVESVGQYALRGGILDIFAPAEKDPVRIEFFGEEIDRMCFFDVMTQRRLEDCACLALTPARELLPDENAKKAMITALKNQIRHAVGQVKDNLTEELESIESGREAYSLDKFISLIYPEKACLFDYAGALMPTVVEYGACMNTLNNCIELENAQVRALIGEGSLSGRYADYRKTASDAERMLFDDFSVFISNMGARLTGHGYAGLFNFRTKQTAGSRERLDLLLEDLRGYMSGGCRVKLICENETAEQSMIELLNNAGFGAYADGADLPQRPSTVAVTHGQSIPGFELIASRYVCINEQSEQTLIKKSGTRKKRAAHDKNVRQILSYADLGKGDYVVHETHGIGRFSEMIPLTVDGVRRDYLKIEYAGADALYLPCDKLDRISKYVGKGAEDGTLKLSHIGEAEWKRAKYRAKAAAKDMAKKLIALYAERMKKPGIAFPRDDAMQRDFEAAFEFEETDCQLNAAEEVKRDMQSSHPMDRLLCGDVGYGKTEVALRAAFKAAEGGYQTAILVPTTILCMQHYRTLLSRMRGFPVSVDMVCRFKTAGQIAESLRKLRRGETDVIVGTHRLLSQDVEFKKLGLLIVDEEQRFGVTHKEKLKALSSNVDVLTLSATPIPRTLNMAISGIRDMSILDEAPSDRMPVQTFVLEEDEGVICEAIRRELRRGGQAFYLCSRIEKVEQAVQRLRLAFPDRNIEGAHGQMDRERLSDIWEEMVEGRIDVLVSTTIIETGVDVPNANTLIIEDADRFGLSQLHQLRGRVGRSARRAYAYFTYPKYKVLTEISEKRLAAIRDYTEFGSGFRIAMRDMELRGVGNLLGAEQHGHMESVGYDLYMKLLAEAVIEEKGEQVKEKTECTVEFGVDAFIPESYIAGASQRIDAYRKISLIENSDDWSDVCDELTDRYGDTPAPVNNLLLISLLRARGADNGMSKIVYKGTSVLFYPEKFNAPVAARLAASFNGKLLISFGGTPYMSLRTGSAKPQQVLRDCVALLDGYALLTEQHQEKKDT